MGELDILKMPICCLLFVWGGYLCMVLLSQEHNQFSLSHSVGWMCVVCVFIMLACGRTASSDNI